MDSEKEKFFKKANIILEQLFPEKINLEELKEFQFFRWEKKLLTYYLKPVRNPYILNFEDLIGIDKVKNIIYQNTIQFIHGFPANNVLLWGERGCGKSSLIKSIVKKCNTNSLKLINVKKDDAKSLEQLFDVIFTLPYKFIIFLDDISFNSENQDFKTLKSILDGGVTENLENILIYATSNRRHMIKEYHINDNEIHESDTLAERISLSDRFGISIGIYKPDKDSYLEIVNHYIKKFSLEKFYREQEALNFAMYKGGFSGRAAYQYVISLLNKKVKWK